MNFENVLIHLQQSVPPEITHYRLNLHPGIRWYLKTAVLNHDPDTDLLEIWRAIEREHGSLVRVSPYCYDWYQNRIDDASTIWVKQGMDVRITIDGDDITYAIVSADVTFNGWGREIQKHLRSAENLSWKEHDPVTWNKLQDVAQLLSSWTTDKQAQMRRQMLKVIKNEECGGSQPNTN